jgi:hypothetical protein
VKKKNREPIRLHTLAHFLLVESRWHLLARNIMTGVLRPDSLVKVNGDLGRPLQGSSLA